MPARLRRIITGFASDGTAKLTIPSFGQFHQFWFGYQNDIQNLDPGVGVVISIEDGIITPSFTRNFLLLPFGDPLPTGFIKYIGRINWAPRTGLFACVEMPLTGEVTPPPQAEAPEALLNIVQP
jgi:hypothetical protein